MRSCVSNARLVANDAEDGAAAADPEKAKSGAYRSQVAADKVEEIYRNFPNSADIQNAAIESQGHADRACRAAAYAAPLAAMGDVYIARDRVPGLLRCGKLDEARRVARNADNIARGLEQRARDTHVSEDWQRAEEARRIVNKMSSAIGGRSTITLEDNGIRFRIESIPGQPNLVSIQVEADDVIREDSTIDGVHLDAGNRVKIRNEWDGKEIPYCISRRGWSHKRTGSFKLHE